MGPLGKGSSSPAFWRTIQRYWTCDVFVVSLNKLFGLRSTGVERRYTSNSGHGQKSLSISSTPRTEGRRTMKRVCKPTLGMLGLLLLGGVLAAGAVCAQPAKDLVGTWTLVSVVTEQGGTKT